MSWKLFKVNIKLMLDKDIILVWIVEFKRFIVFYGNFIILIRLKGVCCFFMVISSLLRRSFVDFFWENECGYFNKGLDFFGGRVIIDLRIERVS